MLRFRNVFYTISKLFHCPAKVFSEQIVHKFAILCCESYTCILIFLCLSFFPLWSYKWDWDWIGLGLCAGLLYEHRFAVLITLHLVLRGLEIRIFSMSGKCQRKLSSILAEITDGLWR